MPDSYATTVLDRLNWFTMQITNQNLFTTTDNLKFTVDDVFYIWECEFNRLLELTYIEPQTNRCQRDFMINYLPGSLVERLEAKSRNNAEATTTFTDNIFHAVVYLEEYDLYRAKNVVKLQNSAVDVKRYSPLQPREAFVGGRTEIFAIHWSRKAESQEFKFVDVCSLYPYVNARSVYLLGHPDLILVATEQENQQSKKSDKRATAKRFQAILSSPGNNTTNLVHFGFLNREERMFKLPPSFPHARQTQLHGELMFSTSFLSRFPFTFVETELLKEELFGLIK